MERQIWAVAKKELRQTVRDPRMFGMLLVAPILQLTLLGFAVNLDVDHIPTALVDLDASPESRELLFAIVADPTFSVSLETRDPDRPLSTGDAKVAIVVPRGFASRLSGERSTEVQVLINGSNPLEAQVALDTTRRFLEGRSLAAVMRGIEHRAALGGTTRAISPLRIEPRTLYNPTLKSPIYMVPGVAAVVLLIVTTVVTAMGIARERELGTIEQLLVTPLRPTSLLLGKVLPFAGIGLVTAGMVIGVGTHLFHVPVRGPVAVLFVSTLLYLMSTLGAGIFISTMAGTQQQAILGGFFFILPAILLSGFMSPIENMPTTIQAITALNPVRYYVEILRANLLKGAGFEDLARPLFALAVFGASILSLGAARFRKRLT